jgi:tetratricopeptide (TPR) repeat protein
MWHYSDLTHPGLNAHLRLTLRLRDPYELSFEQNSIPKELQRKLLEPFGRLKGLYETRIQGEHYDSLEKSLRETMAIPYPSVEKCLEESTRFKDAGNEALKKKEYHEALRLYRESFLHLMIVCDGRRRSIWGDAHFHAQCKGGLYDKQEAQMVRLILRVRLVSNCIMAYLKLEDYEEAKFWGMRSINLMRGGMEGDEVMMGFPAAPSVGKIYYRTGVACREMGDKEEALDLFKVAAKYLPSDKIVQKDLAALLPRIL